MRQTKVRNNLVVVAHPDDETIFFGATILSRPKENWTVICVTDGNADGDHRRRKKQLARACKSLGVKSFKMYDFPDKFGSRLDVDGLVERLSNEQKLFGDFDSIYTHGALGEYGHRHHQDVCYACYQVFSEKKIHTVSYNSLPEKSVVASKKIFAKKAEILTEIYGSETQRFLLLLPVTWSEGTQRISKSEVNKIYLHLCGKRRMTARGLKVYRWFWPQLKEMFRYNPKRSF